MIIVSNHLLGRGGVEFADDVVIRVNLAWVKTSEEAHKVLSEIKGHDIYLDFPQGRTKPPKPVISLDEALVLANQFKVKYFAVSNCEDANEILKIKKNLPLETNFVPKIETKLGIINFKAIVLVGESRYAMLDKEDLYVDVERDPMVYEAVVDLARKKAKECEVVLLELQGVVFA